MSALTALSDDQLFDACVDAIWKAAAGESRGGDPATYNRAMALMAESDRRHSEAGHARNCRASIYHRAFEQATAQHGGHKPQLPECDCGSES